MKEFITAVEEAFGQNEGDEEEGLEFNVDGVMCTCFRPGDGQVAVMMASTGRHSSEQEQVAGIINFFLSTVDDESSTYLAGKLLDRKDKFGIIQVQEILQWMIEEWSGRPTKSSSASTPSRKSTGRKSTAPTPALT